MSFQQTMLQWVSFYMLLELLLIAELFYQWLYVFRLDTDIL